MIYKTLHMLRDTGKYIICTLNNHAVIYMIQVDKNSLNILKGGNQKS